GCRGVFVQGEARTVEEEVLTRRCVIMLLPDFTLERFHDAVQQTAAAMLILVPANISSVPQHVAQPFMASEPEALLSETLIPVYMAHEDSELLSIYEQAKSASLALRSSAMLQGISMVTANGFQMVAGSDIQIKPISDSAIITLEVVSSRFPSVTFGVVHKKINLGDTALAWEHERFGIWRIPGFTLSHLEDPLRGQRGSILDTVSQMDIRKLRRNTAIVAEALASFMYNFTEKEVQESRLSSLVHWLSSQSRAAQLLERDPGLLPTLELQLSRYLRQVQRHTFLTDKR
ncbi:UNVERIFIED_CONTAM: hypothetical protein FKN15_032934, partial [Acipenser sinensis]